MGLLQGHSRPWKGHRKQRVRPGAAPGLLEVVPHAERASVDYIAFGAEAVEEGRIESPSELRPVLAGWPTVWVNVIGIADVETVSAVGEMLGLHRLALEDVVNLGQRAKLEDYDDYLFLVARTLSDGQAQLSEQLSLFLGPTWVVTFQERVGDPFDPVRERIRVGKGRIRSSGADYLTYALLDAVIDNNFPLLERLAERLQNIEVEVMSDPDETTLRHILDLRSELLTIRRDLLPHRDLLQSLIRDETSLIQPSTDVFLRDCADHVDQLIDLLVVYRELSSDLMASYLSSVSNRMNDVMRVLTLFAAIFIPLTFIAGVYGMNFEPGASPWNMPELRWYFGYPFALGLMAVLAGGMLFYFWRIGWIGHRRPRRLKRRSESKPSS